MGKTFDQSLKDTAKISMSMLDVDDYDDTTSEEFQTLRREQQGAHNELTQREDFPFGNYTKTVKVVKGQNTLSMPNGSVKEIWLNGKKLGYTNTPMAFDSKVGIPEMYAILDNPEKIVLYPAPKEPITLYINYYDNRFVETADGDFQWEIEIGSTLRMPERVQHLYFDALEYHLLGEHIKKQTNARFSPTVEIAERKWKAFLQGARHSDNDTYFVL